MKHLLLISALLLSGCVTQSDLAKVSADNEAYHQEQEVVLKLEQNLQSLLNDQVSRTLTWFTRLECTERATKQVLTVYSCTGHALKVRKANKVEMLLEVVVDNKSLTIVGIEKL